MSNIAKPIPPCKNCNLRSITCHSECHAYISYTMKNEEYKKSIQGLNYDGANSWKRTSNVVRIFRKTRRNNG